MSDLFPVTRHKHKSDTRRPRASNHIPLTEAAVLLNVTREHLSRVLHGHRESASLTRRFRALEKSMLKTKTPA